MNHECFYDHEMILSRHDEPINHGLKAMACKSGVTYDDMTACTTKIKIPWNQFDQSGIKWRSQAFHRENAW